MALSTGLALLKETGELIGGLISALILSNSICFLFLLLARVAVLTPAHLPDISPPALLKLSPDGRCESLPLHNSSRVALAMADSSVAVRQVEVEGDSRAPLTSTCKVSLLYAFPTL